MSIHLELINKHPTTYPTLYLLHQTKTMITNKEKNSSATTRFLSAPVIATLPFLANKITAKKAKESEEKPMTRRQLLAGTGYSTAAIAASRFIGKSNVKKYLQEGQEKLKPITELKEFKALPKTTQEQLLPNYREANSLIDKIDIRESKSTSERVTNALLEGAIFSAIVHAGLPLQKKTSRRRFLVHAGVYSTLASLLGFPKVREDAIIDKKNPVVVDAVDWKAVSTNVKKELIELQNHVNSMLA